MPIYRGSGGSGSSNNSALANQVTLDAEAAAESAANAATSATNAATSATDAATSATNAATSATSAATSSGSASTSATTATTKASEAATSATAAATSATTAATEASNAGTSATTAGSQATIATTKATEAAASATTATTKASESATSATASATSATASATSATASATSATASAASATAAAASAAAAAASQEAIDGLYLGAQSSDPTLDLNGDPVTVGDWYFNTTINKSKIYNGSSWDILTSNGSVTSVTGTGTVNGVTLTGTVTTAGNLTLGGTLSGITASQLNSQNISQWTNDSGYTTNTGTVTPSSTDTFTNKSGNISQWTNDSGYITNYTETDTLDSVTDRGATTTNAVTVGNLTSTGIDDNATSTAITIDSSENVGIGTASPSEKLEISANTGATLKITSTDEVLLTGEVIGSIKFESNDASGTPPHISGEISVIAEDDFGRGAMAFSTGRTGDFQEAMRIDASGNVGIGESSPNSKLRVKDSDTTVATLESTGSNAFMSFIDSGTGSRTHVQVGSEDNGMVFHTNDSERMRITSGGKVGIGETIPAADLVVGGSSSGEYDALILRNSSGVDTSSTAITFEVSAGTHGTEAATAAKISAFREGGGTTGALLFHTTDGGVSGERMRIDANGNVGIGTTSMSSVLDIASPNASFRTHIGLGANSDNYFTAGGSGIQVFRRGNAEAMRIDASGNLLVGTTASNGRKFGIESSGPIADFYRTSASAGVGITFWFSDVYGTRSQVAFINAGGGFANYQTNNINLSDEREKKDIVLAESWLDKIAAIPVRNFRYNHDEVDGKHHLGVIAQEVEAVAPELVNKDSWEVRKGVFRDTVYNTDLMFAMMKSIQEQQAIIEDLRARVAQLEGA